MIGVIAGHLGMLIAMWVVLIVIGCSIVARLLTAVRRSKQLGELAEAVTRPLLLDVLPLILLSLLTVIDPTHVLIRIWYYLAAVLIIVRQLMLLGRMLKLR